MAANGVVAARCRAAPVEFVGYDVRVARRDGQRRHGVHEPTRPALERATVRRL